MFKEIYYARLNPIHLLVINGLSFFLTYLLMRYIVTVIIWATIVGDGVYPDSWDLWLELGLTLSPIVALYPFLYYRMDLNRRVADLPRAKSYLFAFLTVLIGSGYFTFRLPS